MSLPASGQLAMSAINTELGRGSTSQISLDTAENGGYGRINASSRSRPSAINPASMSEWYSYDHSSGALVFEQLLGFDRASFDRACVNAINGRFVRYTTDQPEWGVSNFLWSDARGTVLAPAGWYASEFDGIVKNWNGSSFTQERFCRV
jgi:hypothetical protein